MSLKRPVLRKSFFVLLLLYGISCLRAQAQEVSLDYFLKAARQTNDTLYNSQSLQQIGQLQQQIIIAQNKLPQIDVNANVVIAPYFNNNGKVVAITTNPSASAYGYDAGITNGGLYAAQIKVTQQLFNQAIVNNLLFQQKIKNQALSLTYEEVYHNLKNNITRLYLTAYGYQLQESLNEGLIADLETRLKVIAVLVKHGILLQSDYLLVQVSIDQAKIFLEQIHTSLMESLRQLYELSVAPLPNEVKLVFPNLNSMPKRDYFFFQKRFINDSLQIESNRNVFNNKYRPQVSIFVDGGLNAVEIPHIYHRIGASTGLLFTLPIYDGHQKRINAQKIRLYQDNLLNTLKNKWVVKQNNLNSLLDQITSQNKNLGLMEQQLKNQEILRNLYKDKLAQGQVSVIDYLNVIQNYKTAENTRIQMQINLWLLQNQYEYINW